VVRFPGPCHTAAPARIVGPDRSGSGVDQRVLESDGPPPDDADVASLGDPDRLRALAESGLSAASDPEMERFALRVRRWLDVPVALVSLVQPDQQVFPGQVGLPEPWASQRCTPLSHSFCQHVVTTRTALIVSDARGHPRLRDNLAITDLGVIAYAGIPLTDADGNVLGSLCAIDTRPRTWTATEIEALHDLAHDCSTELRLRLARHDADRERSRHDRLEVALRRSFDQSQTLLSASQAFTATATMADVRDQVSELASSELKPSYVGISLLGPDGVLRRQDDTGFPGPPDDGPSWTTYTLAAPVPTATATRLQRIVHYPDRASYDADHPPASQRLLRDLGLHAVVAAPLTGDQGPIGALALGWDRPRRFDPVELLTINTIAGFAAQALHRARLLQHRIGVAHQLQNAMLTDLPDVPGLTMAARYRPADSREHIGGDWFDAVPLPDPHRPGLRSLSVTVGDIVGHNLHAATIMGQVRSMLRQASWDRLGAAPSHILTALETASSGLGIPACGTAVLAHLHPGRRGRWSMTWTNAGHPPPILIEPDGTTRLLQDHDHLFGFAALRARARHDHHVDIEPGSTLFLYTDGLVERRGHDLDHGIDQLRDLLAANQHMTSPEIVACAVDKLASDSPDDVVAFAIHIP
jgi:GAF domain-containing protein